MRFLSFFYRDKKRNNNNFIYFCGDFPFYAVLILRKYKYFIQAIKNEKNEKNEKMKKVYLHGGNNFDYSYYIVTEKKEVIIDKNSLSFLDNTNTKVEIIDENGFSGNFDYVLCQIHNESKTETFIFCLTDEIQF